MGAENDSSSFEPYGRYLWIFLFCQYLIYVWVDEEFQISTTVQQFEMNSARKYIYYAYPWICITQNKKVCDELILLISQAYLDCDFFVINVIHCVCKTKIIINSI